MYKSLFFTFTVGLLAIQNLEGKSLTLVNSGKKKAFVVLTAPVACGGIERHKTSVCYSTWVSPGETKVYRPGKYVVHIRPHSLDQIYVYTDNSSNEVGSASPVPYGTYDLKNYYD